MNLRIFIPTVGEKIIFENIKRFRSTCPHFELTIWYDCCGRGLDSGYYHDLLKETDDMILSTKNQGLAACMGYALLYLPYDYFIFTAPDHLVHPGWFEKAMKPFLEGPKTGLVGEAWRAAMGEEIVIDDFDRGPDGVAIISREAIDACGSVSPSFNGRGPYHTELMRRFSLAGYRQVAMNGLCDHGGTQHEGRNMQPNWEKELHQDNLVYLAMDKKGYKDYFWWSKKLNI